MCYIFLRCWLTRQKFQLLSEDPTNKREGSLQRLLLRLKKKGFFDDSTYYKIYPRGSRPARIYGSPKMHKVKDNNTVPPFRPIVSSIGTFNHPLAKFLSDLLVPLIPGEYSTQDTFTFVDELQQAGIHGKFFTSFDVVSLFTNVPLMETINLAVDYIFDNTPGIKISKLDLKKLFTFATSRTNFLFEGKMYDQIDGVCMGSPLGPTLANLFMSHNESTWLQNYTGAKPLLYKRYVDDIFLAFESKSDSDHFFDYLNCRHKNIQFTKEDEVDQSLPFLDIKIQSADNQVETTVYRKPTFTGLLTNFFSFVPLPYKKGLINTLLFRAHKINSSKEGFEREVGKIKELLEKNSFPSHFIQAGVEKFMTKLPLVGPSSSQAGDKGSGSLKFFRLPYRGKFSSVTQKKIGQICAEYCTDLKVKIVFDTCKLSSFLSPKDKLPLLYKSNLVYKFSCGGCEATYIGETSKSYQIRAYEHLNTDESSAIYKHLHSSPHCLRSSSEEQNFEVLAMANFYQDRKVKEAICIKQQSPDLNKQIRHENISIIV